MRAVVMRGFGGPAGLSYEEVPDPVLVAGDEVLVRVDAAALNHLDLDLCAGTARLPVEFPHILGCEGVGTVEMVGDETSGEWRFGDRVLILEELPCRCCFECARGNENRCDSGAWTGVSRQGTYAELIAVPSEGLIRLPDVDLPPAVWAGVQGAFGTAWHVLVTRAGLRAGETVLVNAVGSGVGSAAMQVALLAGAHVIATAGSDAKLAHAAELGAIGGVNYRTHDVAATVRKLTRGRGVSLVFDHLGGEVLQASLRT